MGFLVFLLILWPLGAVIVWALCAAAADAPLTDAEHREQERHVQFEQRELICREGRVTVLPRRGACG